jgi:hypothetical protein
LCLQKSATQIAKADFSLWDNLETVVKGHMQSGNSRQRLQLWEKTDMLCNARYIKQVVVKHPPPNSISEEMQVGYDKAIAALERSRDIIRKTYDDEEEAARTTSARIIVNADEHQRSETANTLIDLSGSDVDSEQQSEMMNSVREDGDEEGSIHGHVVYRYLQFNVLLKELHNFWKY